MEDQDSRLTVWRPETVVIPRTEFMADDNRAVAIASAITVNNLIKKFMSKARNDDE